MGNKGNSERILLAKTRELPIYGIAENDRADGKERVMFIPERQREALMRLTMCARDECMMCIYQPKDDRCKDIATTAMHILANALKVDDADTPQTDCGWK